MTLVSGQTYTVSVNAGAAGAVSVTIPAAGIKDVAGNDNTVSTSVDNTVTYTPIITFPITYNANSSTGGVIPASQTKTQGISLTLQNNTGVLVRTGFTFSGWNTLANGSGTHYAVGGTFTTDATTTVFAEWTAVSDSDGDGVADTVENLAPNGDGNGDGILDRNQQTVVSASNSVTGSTVTMALTAGCVLINGFTVSSEASLGTDSSFDYPVGLNNFQIQCTSQGETATVKVYYTQNYNTSTWSFRKYRSGTFNAFSTAVTYTIEDIDATLTTNNVTVANFSITDDGAMDADPTDAYIVDPSGPSTAVVTPAPVVPSGGGGGGGGGGGAGVSGVLFCTETITTNCVQPPGYIASSTATTSLKATSTVPLPVVFFPKSASSTTVCQPSIIVTSIIRPGDDTNTDLIKKIQIFLNRYEHAELDVTGVYDIGTVGAIMEFQKKYALQILVPWGIVEPNGLIYTTTVAKMNAIVCGEHLGCPVFTAFSKPDEVNIDAPKIKSLLNVTMGTKLNPNSEFMDKATTNAIKQFQTRYRTFILKPWGLKSATGWWYHTTARQANKFMGCEQKPIVLPNGQKLE